MQKEKLLNTFIISGILFVSCFFAFRFLLVPGFFPMHDDTQIARVYAMHKALSDGMFPVRWVQDLGFGYGYPLFNFYAPLFYYLSAGVSFFGLDALVATKLVLILGIVSMAIGMYLWGKSLWGTYGGILASIAYVFVPYHALDIYVRGDFAEFFASVFIPFVFYFVWQLYKTKQIHFFVGASLSFAAVILSHNLTALMVTPFLCCFVALLFFISGKKMHKQIWLVLYSLALGIGVASFYWIPTFLEMSSTNVLSQIGGGAHFMDHFVCLGQLWDSPWLFGGSTKGCIDGLSFRIGKVHSILFMLSLVGMLFLYFTHKKEILQERNGMLYVFCFGAGLLCFFFLLDSSAVVWQVVGPMAFFQYPWRFLLLFSFFLATCIGSLPWMIEQVTHKEKKTTYLVLGVALISVVGMIGNTSKIFVPQEILPKTVASYTTHAALSWEASKLTSEYMPKQFVKPASEKQLPKEVFLAPFPLVVTKHTTGVIEAHAIVPKEQDILINQAFFPAWHAFGNGTEVSLRETKKGMLMHVPSGPVTLRVIFQQTGIEKMANILSLASLFALVLGIIKSRQKRIL